MNRLLSWATTGVVWGILAGTATPAMAQAGAAEQEVLTNQMVIDMVNAKLPRAIIVGRIQGSRNSFDVTAEGLVFLKQREVPTPIVAAMLQATPVRPPNERLTNEAVIGLVDAKVTREIIVAKIQNTLQAYDVTTAGLVQLQQRKVPQAIIKAMMDEATAGPRAAPATPPAPARRPPGDAAST